MLTTLKLWLSTLKKKPTYTRLPRDEKEAETKKTEPQNSQDEDSTDELPVECPLLVRSNAEIHE